MNTKKIHEGGILGSLLKSIINILKKGLILLIAFSVLFYLGGLMKNGVITMPDVISFGVAIGLLYLLIFNILEKKLDK